MSLIPFDYAGQTVRVIQVDGQPWFVLADLVRALDIKQFRSERLDDDMIQNHPIPDSLGRAQPTAIVTEPGMYEVIIRSDSAAAKPFRRWITSEVLPSIRRTGSYTAPRALPQSYADALRELACEVEAHETTKARVAELEPPATAWMHLADSKGDYAVGDAAKILSRDPSIRIGQNTLFRWLGKHGWLFYHDGWRPYQDKINAGLLTSKINHPFWNSRTEQLEVPAPTVRITPKGIQRLYIDLGGNPGLTEAI